MHTGLESVQGFEDFFAGDLVSVVFADVFVSDVSVFVDNEDGCGCESVAEEVEYVVTYRHVVVLVGVQDGKFGNCFSDDGFGSSEVVGTYG